MGPLKLAPGAEGTRPSRPRPRQGVAVPETAEGAGSGGRVAGVRRECDGIVTGEGPLHRDPENVTLPPVFFRRCDHVTMV